MKIEYLKSLSENGLNVPKFTTSIDEVTWEYSAVRSSADIEDNLDSSCAGLFDSFLNVPKAELNDKIKLVVESYKQNGGNTNSPVIIQEMVQSELSGVLFTANPMGILNEMVVVVGKGLGCNVVDNLVNTTTYYFNTDDKLYDFIQSDDSPLLKENELKELIEIGQKIENIFGKKMDIEFGIADGCIYILQARPITTISNDNIIVLDNSNIVESYPGVSSPLTQSFVKEMYYKIFRCCLLRITNDEKLVRSMNYSLKNMVDVVNGRLYYRISNWYSILKLLPFEKKVIDVWQKMLGVRNLTVLNEDFYVSLGTKLKICTNFLKYLMKTPSEMEKLNDYFDKKFVECKQELALCHTVPDCLDFFEGLKDIFISHWDITLINDMYTFIYTGLAGEKNKKYLADIKDLESLQPILKINELIDAYQQEGLNSIKYKNLSYEYIGMYGDRCMGELKLETDTYKTKPSLLDEFIKGQSKVVIDIEPPTKRKENLFVKNAKIGIANREKSRMNRSRLFGLARQVFLKIGRLMKMEGLLDDYKDIFYLYYDELFNSTLDYKYLVMQRKKEYAYFERIPTYSRLVFSNTIINKQDIGNVSLISDNKLQGVGVSEGIVEGEILVIDHADISLNVEDKIIVTKMTDPGWVFLIKNCKAIITEQGSLLSHTAIISRELKKPAIVNVKNVLTQLKSGDNVKINGLTGEIFKVEVK